MTILAAAAGLLDVLPFRLRRSENRLAIRHLRLSYIGNNVELALHTVDENFQMQFAHA